MADPTAFVVVPFRIRLPLFLPSSTGPVLHFDSSTIFYFYSSVVFFSYFAIFITSEDTRKRQFFSESKPARDCEGNSLSSTHSPYLHLTTLTMNPVTPWNITLECRKPDRGSKAEVISPLIAVYLSLLQVTTVFVHVQEVLGTIPDWGFDAQLSSSQLFSVHVCNVVASSIFYSSCSNNQFMKVHIPSCSLTFLLAYKETYQ